MASKFIPISDTLSVRKSEIEAVSVDDNGRTIVHTHHNVYVATMFPDSLISILDLHDSDTDSKLDSINNSLSQSLAIQRKEGFFAG